MESGFTNLSLNVFLVKTEKLLLFYSFLILVLILKRNQALMKGIEFRIQKAMLQIDEILLKPVMKLTPDIFEMNYARYCLEALSIAELIINSCSTEKHVPQLFQKAVERLKQARKCRPEAEDEEELPHENDEIQDFLNSRKPVNDIKNLGQMNWYLDHIEKKEKETEIFLKHMNQVKKVENVKKPLTISVTKYTQTIVTWIEEFSAPEYSDQFITDMLKSIPYHAKQIQRVTSKINEPQIQMQQPLIQSNQAELIKINQQQAESKEEQFDTVDVAVKLAQTAAAKQKNKKKKQSMSVSKRNTLVIDSGKVIKESKHSLLSSPSSHSEKQHLAGIQAIKFAKLSQTGCQVDETQIYQQMKKFIHFQQQSQNQCQDVTIQGAFSDQNRRVQYNQIKNSYVQNISESGLAQLSKQQNNKYVDQHEQDNQNHKKHQDQFQKHKIQNEGKLNTYLKQKYNENTAITSQNNRSKSIGETEAEQKYIQRKSHRKQSQTVRNDNQLIYVANNNKQDPFRSSDQNLINKFKVNHQKILASSTLRSVRNGLENSVHQLDAAKKQSNIQSTDSQRNQLIKLNRSSQIPDLITRKNEKQNLAPWASRQNLSYHEEKFKIFTPNNGHSNGTFNKVKPTLGKDLRQCLPSIHKQKKQKKMVTKQETTQSAQCRTPQVLDLCISKDQCYENETDLIKKDSLIMNKIVELQRAKADQSQISFYVDMFQKMHQRTCGSRCKHLDRFYKQMKLAGAWNIRVPLQLATRKIGFFS